ncbi:helix-turn-helix domain-containing protein [Sorangium sp. So ce118]
MFGTELFDEADQDGWPALARWVESQLEESVYLDFKRAMSKGADIHQDDIKNLSKSLSGFANTGGGLLVFGIDAVPKKKGEPSSASSLVPVSNIRLFREAIQKRVRQCTIPPIAGIDTRAISSPDDESSGILLILVPPSDGGPHRAAGSTKEVNDKYYMRTADETAVMPHELLADRFSRRAPTKLQLEVEHSDKGELLLIVRNLGRGTARSLLLRLEWTHPGFDMKVSRYPINDERWRPTLLVDSNKVQARFADLLYPEDYSHFTRIHFPNDPSGGRVVGRIDCEDSQPVLIDGTVPDRGSKRVYPGTA